MDTLDTAIDLATAVVKSGFLVWAGPFGQVPNTIADLIKTKVTDRLQQRRAERFFENCVDTVAQKLLKLINQHGETINITDLNASIYAVRDTFNLASVTSTSLMKADLDARTLERNMKVARTEILHGALLSESGEHFYNLLLRESCTYTLELVSTLPNYDVTAFAEILKRETRILSSLQDILARLPDRESVDDFATDYRRLVIQRLDRMQLFGAKLQSDYGRRYPLSIAYTSLGAASSQLQNEDSAQEHRSTGTVVEETGSVFRAISTDAYSYAQSRYYLRYSARPNPALQRINALIMEAPRRRLVAGEVSVEQWLANEHRVLLIGEAGSGKSTLCNGLP